MYFGDQVLQERLCVNRHFLNHLEDEINILRCSLYVKTNRFNTLFCNAPRLTHSHTMTPFDAPGKQAF